MIASLDPAVSPEAATKPRLVLMGEFSAGKSTLSNLLLGGSPLPVRVTATRLPPVHVSAGAPGAYRLDRHGQRHEIALADLGQVRLDDTRSVHLTMDSDLLELCDLVDMPGISDPNMPSDTWDGLASARDIVVWCTHATQAWRQSEAAAWDRMRGATSGRNLLLINQIDKLRTERDRQRVLARVLGETADKFLAVYPVSLLEALNAGEDFDAWQASGAGGFMDHLVDLLIQWGRPAAAAPTAAPTAAPNATQTATQAGSPGQPVPPAPAAARHAPPVEQPRHGTARIITLRLENPLPPESAKAAMPADAARAPRVSPRRVQANPGPRERPHAPRRGAADVADAATAAEAAAAADVPRREAADVHVQG